jgi:predicted ArsR family transcriptional regulator
VREMVYYKRGITVEKLSDLLQISVSSVQRRLSDLQELKIVQSEKKSDQKRRGRPTNVWSLTESMTLHWTKAKVGITRIDYGE